MQTQVYASGFLYHKPSGRILLQQIQQGADVSFTMFRRKCGSGNNPRQVFRRYVEFTLKRTVADATVVQVYDYIRTGVGKHIVFYVETADITPDTLPSGAGSEWLLLAKLSKYPMSEQTRHDIIIGGRVIRAKADKSMKPVPRHLR